MRTRSLYAAALTLAAATTTAADAAGPRGAHNFDGFETFASVPAANSPALANRSFTIEFWLRERFTTDPRVVVVSDPATPFRSGLEITSMTGGTVPGLRFGWDGSELFAASSQDVGIWVHWACSFDAATNNRRIFRNGILAAEDTAAPLEQSGPLRIGGRDPGNDILNGELDELRIWGQPLDAAQVSSRLLSELDPTTAGSPDVLAYYPLGTLSDHGVGAPGANDLTDASGNGAHAGTTTTDDARPWKQARDITNLTPEFGFTVTTTDFTGDGSLDEASAAVLRATLVAGDIVTRIDLTGVTGTIQLDRRLIFAGTTIVEGPGANQLTLDGSNYDGRAFVPVSGATLVVKGLTLSNFESLGDNGTDGGGGDAGYGGAIWVQGGSHLHCEDVVFDSNQARGGDGSVNLRGGLGGKGRQYAINRPPNAGEQVGPGGAGGRAGNIAPDFPNGEAGGKGRDNGGWDPVLGGGGDGLFAFGGGNGGRPGGGGGGGEGLCCAASLKAGNGGAGGQGGNGGHGSFGGGGGAGGSGGGGGGGGDRQSSTQPGDAGLRGDGGAAGLGGFGAGDATAGPRSNYAARGHFDSGNGGYGGGDPNWTNHPDWKPLGAGGGGAALGGAVFVESRASVSLTATTFKNNHAQGGAGGNPPGPNSPAAGNGRGIGSALFLMPATRLVGSPDASYQNNTATGPDGTTPDSFTAPIFGLDTSDPLLALRGGNDPTVPGGLYYADAVTLENDPASAAFRYRWSIWQRPDTGGPLGHQFLLKPGSGAADPDTDTIFSPADRSAAANARTAAAALFAANPDDPATRDLLLDITYDTAAVLGFIAGFERNRAERDARNVEVTVQSSLDQHIAAYANPGGILDAYRDALDAYRPVLENPDQFAALAAALPGRDFLPLQYIDDTDPTIEPPLLRDIPGASRDTDGYRDLALLFELLASYGDAGYRLAELYLARENPGDRDLGLAVAGRVERSLFTSGELLQNLLPATPGTALAAATGRWSESLNSLANIQTRLGSEVNALGFNDDFLFLVGGGQVDDSFAYLYNRLDQEILGTFSGPEGSARYELEQATAKLDAYLATKSQFLDRRADLRAAIDSRLIEIGSLPEPPSPGNGNVAQPATGEIAEQLLRIENAKTGIALNRTDVSNLHAEIRIAVETNDAVKAANLTIADIKVGYLNRQRGLDREIAQLEAAQATADRAVAFLDVTSYTGAVVGAANMAFQGWADQQQIDLNDRKAELAAAETLEITDTENVIRDAELDGFIKTRLLGLKRLSLESLIATNTLTQELNRLAALITEQQRLERELAGLDAALADRYYADPIHQLRYEDAGGRAEITFRRAQLWTFIVIRALEYKWNQPFTDTPDSPAPTVNGDGTWDIADLFASRNARDLRDLANAIDHRNTDLEITIGAGLNPSRSTVFSVRDQFFELGGDIAAFRDELAHLRDNDPASSDGDIRIPFHTVRTPRNDSFFRGASYDEDLELDNEGVALDKIVWVKLVVIGDFDGEFNPFLQQNRLANSAITYGGTTYVRNIDVGTLEDPQNPGNPVRPDRIYNELTAYETRNYDLTGTTFPPPVSSNILRDTGVEALVYDTSLATNPDLFDAGTPGSPSPFVNRKFAGRSVAATDWSINLEVEDADFPIEKIDDIYVIIHHQNFDRSRN